MIFARSYLITLLTILSITGYAQSENKLIGIWKLYKIDEGGTIDFSEVLIFFDSTFEQITKSDKEIFEMGQYVVKGNELILKTKRVTGFPDTARFHDRIIKYEWKERELMLIEQFDPIYTGEKEMVYQTYYFRKRRRR